MQQKRHKLQRSTGNVDDIGCTNIYWIFIQSAITCQLLILRTLYNWTVFQTTVSVSQLKVPACMCRTVQCGVRRHVVINLSSSSSVVFFCYRRSTCTSIYLYPLYLSSRNRPVLSNFLRHQSTYALGVPCAELNWWITMRLQQHATPTHRTVPCVTFQNIKAVHHVFSISEALIRRHGFWCQQISGHCSLLSVSRPVSTIAHMINTPIYLQHLKTRAEMDKYLRRCHVYSSKGCNGRLVIHCPDDVLQYFRHYDIDVSKYFDSVT